MTRRLLVFLLASGLAMPAFADTPDTALALDTDSSFTVESGLELDESLFELSLDDDSDPPRYRRVRRTRTVRRRRVRRVRRQPVQVVQPARQPARASNIGPYLTLGGVGHFVIDDAGTTLENAYDGGGGFLIGIGFRLTPMLALEANWMASFQSTSVQTNLGRMPVDTIHSINLDAKIFFLPWSQRIEPFLQVGIGAYMLSDTFAYELSGFGFDIGGGVDIRFTDSVGLGLKVLYRGFFVDNTDADYYVYLQRESAFIDSVSTEATLQFYF